jgi:hypothetical protein
MARGSMIRSGGGGGGGGGAGGLTGATPGSYNSASGGIPGVTSPISTVTGNLGDLSGIINSITQTQSGALRDQYPDEYFNILGTLLGNTQRRASGDISDLLPELQQNSAEAAVAGGVSGSGAENTKLLRDMGLTRYGVENEAINSLGKIQGQIPTVRPYDPSGIIGAQIDAQERADIYRAAPVPEDAYQRALRNAGGSGGGATGGRSVGGVVGGPAGGAYTPINRGQANMLPQSGTAMNPMGGGGSASPQWGSFPNALSNTTPGGDDAWLTELFGDDWQNNFQDSFDPMWDANPMGMGGALNYGGGLPYSAGNTTQQNYEDFDPWMASLLDVTGGAGAYGYDPVTAGGGAYDMVSSGGDDYYNDLMF